VQTITIRTSRRKEGLVIVHRTVFIHKISDYQNFLKHQFRNPFKFRKYNIDFFFLYTFSTLVLIVLKRNVYCFINISKWPGFPLKLITKTFHLRTIQTTYRTLLEYSTKTYYCLT
jgi:hypothetical protein